MHCAGAAQGEGRAFLQLRRLPTALQYTAQVPGRVGDAAVPGGGAYADSDVGACGSTGDGDVHLRFLPCYQVLHTIFKIHT